MRKEGSNTENETIVAFEMMVFIFNRQRFLFFARSHFWILSFFLLSVASAYVGIYVCVYMRIAYHLSFGQRERKIRKWRRRRWWKKKKKHTTSALNTFNESFVLVSRSFYTYVSIALKPWWSNSQREDIRRQAQYVSMLENNIKNRCNKSIPFGVNSMHFYLFLAAVAFFYLFFSIIFFSFHSISIDCSKMLWFYSGQIFNRKDLENVLWFLLKYYLIVLL